MAGTFLLRVNPRFRKWLLLALGGGVGVLIVCWLFAWDSCPRYAGHSLRESLGELRTPNFIYTDGVTTLPRVTITNRVQAMAKEAVPWLLRELQATDTRYTTVVNGLLNRQSILGFRVETAGDRKERAYFGFMVLGESGRDGIPELASMARQNKDIRTAGLLGCMGPAGMPTLTSWLKDGDESLRSMAVEVMAQSNTKDRAETARMIIEAFDDPSESVRVAALGWICRFGSDAEAAIPKLVAVMQRENEPESSTAMGSLGIMGLQGPYLIPLISPYLESTNDIVANAAAQALRFFKNDSNLVMDAFESFAKSDDPQKRELVAFQLRDYELSPKRTLALLSMLVHDPHGRVRYRAIMALANQPEVEPSTIAWLKEMQSDQSLVPGFIDRTTIGYAAEFAVRRIEHFGSVAVTLEARRWPRQSGSNSGSQTGWAGI